jgi:3-isopropylmalate/(R)-2-methylmalate dehydratase large subunit
MAIEGGARSGLIAPDDKTYRLSQGPPDAPKGEQWDKAVAWWRTLPTDAQARYDRVVTLDATDIAPA